MQSVLTIKTICTSTRKAVCCLCVGPWIQRLLDPRIRGRNSSREWIAYVGRNSRIYLIPWSDLFIFWIYLIKTTYIVSLKWLQRKVWGAELSFCYRAEMGCCWKINTGMTDLLSWLMGAEAGQRLRSSTSSGFFFFNNCTRRGKSRTYWTPEREWMI